MKIVVFGLTITSSWGNGHATLWRGLCRALIAAGHRVVFYERDVPYYAAHRDLSALPGMEIVLYGAWADTASRARRDIADADAAMATSYCPDGPAASALILEAPRALRVFYDLDTPVTLAQLESGSRVPYLPEAGLGGFDLVFSYTGGGALDALITRLGARVVRPLYGHGDPEVHRPAAAQEHYRCDLSYLGTYAEDRQARLERLFVGAAARMPDRRFLIGGAQYPRDFPWAANIFFVRHLPPAEHASFFASSRFTLNVTRDAMAAMGWCPSGRLFEAALCGVPLISDMWDGLDHFFTPGTEIIVGGRTEDVVNALSLNDAEVARIGKSARERALAEHTSAHRARRMIADMEAVRGRSMSSGEAA